MPDDSPLFAQASRDAPAKVLVIAELGVNHDGRLDRALELVQAARNAFATAATHTPTCELVGAVKVQLFQPDRLLSNQAKLAQYQESRQAANDAHSLLAGLTLTHDQFKRVAQAARQAGLKFIATPFSSEDVDQAAALGVDAVKIASPDAVNTPLLTHAATLGVPLLISTGTCELDELRPAATLLRGHHPGGCLLQCVSSYPVPDEFASLGGMAAMRDALGDPPLPMGYSDHTASLQTGALAVAAGAVVIEKHLTYDRSAAGPDHAASLDPPTFADYVARIHQAAAMLGPTHKSVLPLEADVREVSRQSVCATANLPAGHRLTARDLTFKRPGTGIPAAQLPHIIGRTLVRPVRQNDLLTWDDVNITTLSRSDETTTDKRG